MRLVPDTDKLNTYMSPIAAVFRLLQTIKNTISCGIKQMKHIVSARSALHVQALLYDSGIITD